jgi:subfamily B ATP-binding cassette protein MsbA
MREKESMKTSRRIKRILLFLKPYRRKVAVAFVIMVIVMGFSQLDLLILKYVLDRVLVSNPVELDYHWILRRLFGTQTIVRNSDALNILVLTLIGLYILRGVLNTFYGYILSFIGQRILFDIRLRLFEHLETLHLDFFTKTRTGDIMSRISSDVAKLQDIVSNTFITLIRDSLMLLVILGYMIFINWQLTLLSLSVLPLFFISQSHFGKKIKRRSKHSREKSADLMSFLQERITGIRLIQSFAREKVEALRLSRKGKELLNVRMKLVMLSAGATSIAGFLAVLGPVLVIWRGGHSVIHGTVTIGGLVALYTYMGRLFAPIFRLAQYNVDIQAAIASVDRIFEFMDIAPSIKDAPNSTPLNSVKGDVVFSNVTFSYDHDEPVIHDLSFVVRHGEKIGVVGRSGEGKSTLIHLLCRFYEPQSGAIFLDNRDIREITLHSLRRTIGLVSQETILFNSTIRENIRYGNMNASDDDIIDAAKQVHIHDFIHSLPLAYETLVGERGIRLSGGERQRISIARTVLKDPKILILDEATSALDTKSERLIHDSLKFLMEGRTCFMIAHRLTTLVDVDRIIVLKEGKAIESGSHAALLRAEGEYREMWDEMLKKDSPNRNDPEDGKRRGVQYRRERRYMPV